VRATGEIGRWSEFQILIKMVNFSGSNSGFLEKKFWEAKCGE